jgi:uncharacterized membrane protein (UPF0127 family)
MARMRGLLGRRGLDAGEGLLITGCSSVHTIGMQFIIDVAFLDGSGHVVAVYHKLPPGRVTAIVWQARAALELPAGTLARCGVAAGDKLDLIDEQTDEKTLDSRLNR